MVLAIGEQPHHVLRDGLGDENFVTEGTVRGHGVLLLGEARLGSHRIGWAPAATEADSSANTPFIRPNTERLHSVVEMLDGAERARAPRLCARRTSDNTVSMIDLNDVRIFERVASLHGFSAAAKALALPKSTVSGSIARLEAELGVRLLHRTTRDIALTTAGEALYHHVAALIGQLNLALDDLQVHSVSAWWAPQDIGGNRIRDQRSRRSTPALSRDVDVALNLTNQILDLVPTASTSRSGSARCKIRAASRSGWEACADHIVRRAELPGAPRHPTVAPGVAQT